MQGIAFIRQEVQDLNIADTPSQEMKNIYQSYDQCRAILWTTPIPANNVVCLLFGVSATLIAYRHDVKPEIRHFGYSETSVMSDFRKVM